METLLGRIDYHCSNHIARNEESEIQGNICENYGYTTDIHAQIYKTKTTPTTNKQEIRMAPNTYMQGTSEEMARIIEAVGFRIAHVPNQTLRTKLQNIKSLKGTHQRSLPNKIKTAHNTTSVKLEES